MTSIAFLVGEVFETYNQCTLDGQFSYLTNRIMYYCIEPNLEFTDR